MKDLRGVEYNEVLMSEVKVGDYMKEYLDCYSIPLPVAELTPSKTGKTIECRRKGVTTSHSIKITKRVYITN